MTSTGLKVLTLPAPVKHTATVIFFHGLGDSGEGWRPIATMMQMDPTLKHIKWILPLAPVRPVSLTGTSIPAWFDMQEGRMDSDEEGVLEAITHVRAFIAEEIKAGTPANRIVLAGFSQGAALTLLAGLTDENRLAGLLPLSGGLVESEKFVSLVSEYAKSVPIFWAHGEDDTTMPLALAKTGKEYIVTKISIPEAAEIGSPGLYQKIYPKMAHQTCPQELADVGKFLATVIPRNPKV